MCDICLLKLHELEEIYALHKENIIISQNAIALNVMSLKCNAMTCHVMSCHIYLRCCDAIF